MFLGCENKDCKHAFCRCDVKQEIVLATSEQLKIYGSLFLCENRPTLMEYKHDNLDFSISERISKICMNHDDKSKPTIDFQNLKENDNQYNIIFEMFFCIIDFSNRNEKLDYLEHIFCDLLKTKKTGVELFLFENLFLLLLEKYDFDGFYELGLIILRIFVSFEDLGFMNYTGINTICNGFIDVHSKTKKLFFNDTQINDFGKECLLKDSFTTKDYVHLVESFCILLETLQNPFIRTNPILYEILNTFTMLYTLNEKMKIFPFKKFYLSEFCKKQNFKEEFRYYKVGNKSIFSFAFILPIEIKAEFLKYENGDVMKASLQDAFFRALFEGPMEPYLFITVGRNTVYKDTFDLLENIKIDDLKKQIKITFKNEEGVDSGGIRKEYFQLLSEELSEDDDLFVAKNNALWIKPTTNIKKFEILGKIIGIALYNDVILNIPFPSLFFKKLLEKEIELNDLIEIEPEIYSSLNNLKKCTTEELNSLELTFRINFNNKDVDLLENGSKIKVTKCNISEFVRLYMYFLIEKSIIKQFKAIKKGFNCIIKRESISFLQPKELEKIIAGSTFIDVETLKKHCTINGFDHNSGTVKNFWEIFDNYVYEDRKKLLQFITGNDRIPISGAENLKLVIMKNGCDSDRLPSSQTCFNTLLLPEYNSKDQLKEKLDKAITMTKGFYLL